MGMQLNKNILRFFKSLLQKSVRRIRPDISMKVFVNLFLINKNVLVRRFPMVLLEDVGVLDDKFVVYFDLIKSKTLDDLFSLDVINRVYSVFSSNVRNYPFYLKYLNLNGKEKSYNKDDLFIDISKCEYDDLFRRMIKYRLKLGGCLEGDTIMLYSYLKEFDNLTKLNMEYKVFNFSSYSDFILSKTDLVDLYFSVDVHCSPIKVYSNRFRNATGLDLSLVLWCCDAGVNNRVCVENNSCFDWFGYFGIEGEQVKKFFDSYDKFSKFIGFRLNYINKIYDYYVKYVVNKLEVFSSGGNKFKQLSIFGS